MAQNPDQGTLFLPGTHGGETIAATEHQFAAAGPAVDSEGLATDLVERNRRILEALGLLSIAAETTVATTIDTNPTARRNFESRYGDSYQSVVDGMVARNEAAQTDFKSLFRRIWGVDEVKASGLADSATLRTFSEDRDRFAAKFSQSQGVTTQRARSNRGNYQRQLQRQATVYKRNNLGLWPEVTK